MTKNNQAKRGRNPTVSSNKEPFFDWNRTRAGKDFWKIFALPLCYCVGPCKLFGEIALNESGGANAVVCRACLFIFTLNVPIYHAYIFVKDAINSILLGRSGRHERYPERSVSLIYFNLLMFVTQIYLINIDLLLGILPATTFSES